MFLFFNLMYTKESYENFTCYSRLRELNIAERERGTISAGKTYCSFLLSSRAFWTSCVYVLLFKTRKNPRLKLEFYMF